MTGLIATGVDSANAPDHPFPVNNLLCGQGSVEGDDLRCGVAVGAFVLDVAAREEAGLEVLGSSPFLDVHLRNDVIKAGPAIWAALRARHTPLGGPMNVGDLSRSRMISGAAKDSRGSPRELSWGDREPFAIADGTRSFIKDQDQLTPWAACRGDGYPVSFGDCVGAVIPALADPWKRT